MKIKEHTAQLSTQHASEVQSSFEKGEVNILSCSTTFEMGVDVGSLEAVFYVTFHQRQQIIYKELDVQDAGLNLQHTF